MRLKGDCIGCGADLYGALEEKCGYCRSYDLSAEIVELKVQLARAVKHGTDEEAQKWTAITERDVLKAELEQLQKFMQPIIDMSVPTPSLLVAVEAMALGSKMIFDAQKRRIEALRAALITLAPSVAVLSRDERHHPDTRAEMRLGEQQMLVALMDTVEKP